MKVLTFTTLYPNAERPAHGIFVETRLRQLLASGQVHSTVVAPVPWFPFAHPAFGAYAAHARAPGAETRNGIEVLHPRFPALPKIGMTLAPYLLYRGALSLVERLRRERGFDLVDAHYFYPDGVAAAMLGRRLGVPAVITARGTDVNLIAQHRIPRRMIRWAANQAGAIVAVSQALKEKLAALGVERERIHVLRNGVDLELFHPQNRDALRAQLELRAPTLLSVGNLLAFKGHGVAIEALSLLRDYELVIAGDGPDRAAFEALARECGVSARVRFVGSLSQQDLRRYYCAADALVLASSREGWPNVLLEAMACGTPVIATAVGGVPEIVTSRNAGAVVQERSAPALARAVRELFARPPERAATRRFAEEFGWGATTKGQLQLFRQVLAASSPQPAMQAARAG
ncbi:MAG TPA: glycosyltransferase family 4 protein [Burkholderiales bacterium]|nr:glycosyltransferase family 4 protein [Burkholderiales bacterium]